MNRAQLQKLAQIRLDDAQALLAASRWSAAYYLAGYAVECALKSCVLKHVHDSGEIFANDDGEYLKKLAKCRTHDLEDLVRLAGLEVSFGVARGANPALNVFWDTVKTWEESTRYQEKTEIEARELTAAITHQPDGVFAWIQQYW